MTPEMSRLALKFELDYLIAKSRYDMEAKLLRMERERFYAANPNFPYQTMFMQVTAPPQTIIITEI